MREIEKQLNPAGINEEETSTYAQAVFDVSNFKSLSNRFSEYALICFTPGI